MIERIVFHGEPYRGPEYRPELEWIEVHLTRDRIKAPLIPSRHSYMGRSSGTESREEYGYRLRRAAAEAARYIEGQIIAELRSMGHLV